MADFTVNSINTKGTAVRTADALGVSYTLASRPEFKATISNPQQRDEFVRGIKIRQEMALAGGNKKMYDLYTSLLNFTKSNATSNLPETTNAGRRFDTNNLYTV